MNDGLKSEEKSVNFTVHHPFFMRVCELLCYVNVVENSNASKYRFFFKLWHNVHCNTMCMYVYVLINVLLFVFSQCCDFSKS